MHSTDRLRARYPEFLQTADPPTEAVVAALDAAYSLKAPEQLRAQIAQIPSWHQVISPARISGGGTIEHAGRKAANARSWRRLGSHALDSKQAFGYASAVVIGALLLALVLVAGRSLGTISSRTAGYGSGAAVPPTSCASAAARFPGESASASARGHYVVRVLPSPDLGAVPITTITSSISQPGGHNIKLLCSAAPYRDARVRVSADLRLLSTSASAGLYLVISGPPHVSSPDGELRADTMQDRAITGSVTWRTYSVVLDVPEEATGIRFGPWLDGVGTLSVRRLRFDPVGSDVAATAFTVQPRNLDFSHGLIAWFRAGTAPTSFTMSLQPHSAPGGIALAIQSRVGNQQQFGTVLQEMSAASYLGERIRFSADVKTERMTGPVALWMRVDGRDRTLAFDSMEQENRAIIGTTAWRRYSVTVNVPQDSEDLYFGILFQRTGALWMAHGSLSPVGTSMPAT